MRKEYPIVSHENPFIPNTLKGKKKGIVVGIKVCSLSAFLSHISEIYQNNSKKLQKVLDKPLTLVYISYVEWLRGNKERLLEMDMPSRSHDTVSLLEDLK